jgi:hypothetical protein
MLGLAMARVNRIGLWALGAVALGAGAAAAGTAGAPGAAGAAAAAEVTGAAPSLAAPAMAVEALAPLPATVAPVASYSLSARLDADTHTIHGQGTLTWVNTSQTSVEELYFHLYLNAFQDEHSVFNRSAFTRARSGRAPRRWGSITLDKLAARELGGVDLLASLEPHSPGDPLDRTDRRLPLPRPVAAGETLTIELAWTSVLPDIVERTGAVQDFHFAGQWFPKIARLEQDGRWAHFPFHPHAEFYADFGDYDVTLDVPEAMVVGATGRRISEQVADGRRRVRQRVGSVHDFAWTAWPSFEQQHERMGSVDVHLLYPPGHGANAERTLAALRFALPHFSERYGEYPYPDLTVVHPPAFGASAGGMEYPTLITTGGAWHQAYWSRAVELVTIHELGHQWFYGLVASDETRWPFLDEGLNSYAENIAAEALFGPASAAGSGGLQISATALHRASMLLAPEDAPIARAASEFVDFGELGALVYSRSAMLFRTLGNVYGPERMASALRRYATRFRFAHPGPEALLGVLEAELGPDAAANARAALFEGAGVNYSLRDLRAVRRTAAAQRESPGLYESRVLVHRSGELRFPVDVLLIHSDGHRASYTWSGEGRDEVIRVTGDYPVVSARVDPDDRVLLDENLLDNAFGAPRPTPLDSWARVVFAFQLLLGGLTP